MSNFTPEQLESIQYQQMHIGDDRSYQVIVSNVVMGVIAVLAVVARIISRRLAGVKFASDDYLVFFALLTFFGYIGTSAVAVANGLGKHIILVTNPYNLGWSFIVSECMYNVTIPCLKLSLLVLYGRIFPQRWFKMCLIANAVFVIAYSVAFFFADLFQCVPISHNWDPTVPATCVNYVNVVITGAVVNATSDIMLLVLPVPLIWKLNMKQDKRVRLIVMFTIGALCCLSSLVRIGFAHELAEFDATWADVPIIVTTTVELGISVLAACIPTYTTILNYFTGSLATTKASKSYYSNAKLVHSADQSSNMDSSRKHTWQTMHESRASDDVELVRKGGQVNTTITTGL